MKRTLAITGANGMLGSHLVEAFASHGWTVRAGVRHPDRYHPPCANVEPFHCELPGGPDPSALEEVEVLIHAAYETRFRSRSKALQVNFGGTRGLLRAARETGVPRRVFISSCSAHPLALSFYGRSKLALEKEFQAANDLVIRPGLIVARGGLFGRMAETVRRSRVVPLFDGGGQLVQTIHIDDVTEGILRAIEGNVVGRLILAEPDGITMSALMRRIAEAQRRRPIFFSVPSFPALVALRIAEAACLPLPVTSENLLGLRSMVHQDARPGLERLGLDVRPAEQAITDVLRE